LSLPTTTAIIAITPDRPIRIPEVIARRFHVCWRSTKLSRSLSSQSLPRASLSAKPAGVQRLMAPKIAPIPIGRINSLLSGCGLALTRLPGITTVAPTITGSRSPQPAHIATHRSYRLPFCSPHNHTLIRTKTTPVAQPAYAIVVELWATKVRRNAGSTIAVAILAPAM